MRIKIKNPLSHTSLYKNCSDIGKIFTPLLPEKMKIYQVFHLSVVKNRVSLTFLGLR